MVFNIYNNRKYTSDKIIIGIYTVLIVLLIGAMYGGSYGGGSVPTFFEKHELPLSAYIVTSLLTFVIFILLLSKIFSLGLSKRLTIDSERVLITTSILQRQFKIDWKAVTQIAPDYGNWKEDLSGQIWMLEHLDSDNKEVINFVVNESVKQELNALIKEKLTVPNKAYS